MSVAYADFLEKKLHQGAEMGFDPACLPDFLFDFQRVLVAWAIRKGRGAVFADCGLGKTPMELVWAEAVMRETNRSVLILTPLAVAPQTVREGKKFGIECHREPGPGPRIVVTNYERLHRLSPDDYAGVVCDESSAIKSFDGKRRAQVTEFLRTVPYRSLWTATAAPNDYIELGTSSEALGEMGHMDMLARFFVNDQNTSKPVRMWNAHKQGAGANAATSRGDWRFKGHSEVPFWRWVCSWARACRKPSDLGFDDKAFVLPPLLEREHVVVARKKASGMLFAVPAVGLVEEREERRRTITERCEQVAELVATGKPAVVWCHLNSEGDRLAEIPDARQVKGGDSDEEKEEAYEAFAAGQLRVLVIKPKIGAWGLNWQHCAHVVTFASHSYEQHYQAVRRCWRFGQKEQVTVDVVATEGEAGIRANLARKSAAADRMFTELVAHMNAAIRIDHARNFKAQVEVPSWL